MVKQFVPAIIAALCIGIGGASAYFLKSTMAASGEPASTHAAASDEGNAHEKATEGHGEKKDSHADNKKKDSGGHGKSSSHGGDTAIGDVTYYKFTREFVVPMIENDRVQSLVILNLNLEVDSAISQKLFSKEPVLRDNIMTTLIQLSSGGRTLYSITDVHNYETVRSEILTNLRNEVPEGIHNVLILDMARQDL